MNDLVETPASLMVAQDDIRSRIHTIRGMQVILDSDLAINNEEHLKGKLQPATRNERNEPKVD